MEVTVDLIGEEPQTVEVDGETYGDVLRAIDLSPQAATVLVDGRPVPEDREIDQTEVRVLRLISGGASDQRKTGVTIRSPRPRETDEIIGLLDAALLAFDREAIRSPQGSTRVRVAVEDDRVLGALLVREGHIEAIAVRPRHRHRGIGSSLIAHVADEHTPITADCAPRVRGFFESVGFRMTERPNGRWCGALDECSL